MPKHLQKLKRSNPLYESSIYVGIIAFIISLLFHFVSLERVSSLPSPGIKANRKNLVKNQVKIRLADKRTHKRLEKTEDQQDSDEDKQIVETPQAKTEKPKDAKALGVEDHIAKEETRIDPKFNQKKGLDAGEGGADKVSKKSDQVPQITVPKKTEIAQKNDANPGKKTAQKPRISITDTGNLSFSEKPSAQNRKSRNDYEKLLNTAYNQLEDQVSAGYQEYLDESYKVGNHIDINTTSYRYIGYFSSLRKAIELVWNYPSEASMRGMQGKVTLEFRINLDGSATKIRVLKSSGYSILDTAIVDAIRVASPFSPLPSGIATQPLYVKGSFIYQLQAMAH